MKIMRRGIYRCISGLYVSPFKIFPPPPLKKLNPAPPPPLAPESGYVYIHSARSVSFLRISPPLLVFYPSTFKIPCIFIFRFFLFFFLLRLNIGERWGGGSSGKFSLINWNTSASQENFNWLDWHIFRLLSLVWSSFFYVNTVPVIVFICSKKNISVNVFVVYIVQE